jgi:dienelactone hydrolase
MGYRRALIGWVQFVFLLAACQPGSSTAIFSETPTVSPTSTPYPTHTPTVTETPEPTLTITPTKDQASKVTASPPATVQQEKTVGERVEIAGEDGLAMVGTFYTPSEQSPPWPGVLLLHMMWGERSSWEAYAQQLAEAGYAVLAVDMRGHGDTGGEVDWDLAGMDLQHAWNYLRERADTDEERIAVLGASIGANLGLDVAAKNSEAKTVVLLSPGLDYAGVETRDPLLIYGERPLLIVASQEDTYAADSARKLEEIALGEISLVMYQDAGHGLHMFDREPGLASLIIDWLEKHVQLSGPED